MRRDRNTNTIINTKLFNKLFLQWWKDNCSEALAGDAEEKFRELFIAAGGDAGITSYSTIHNWRFRHPAPALSEISLLTLEKIFGVSVTSTATEEKNMTYTPKAFTVDAQMAIEFYGLLVRFLNGIDFDSSLDDTEQAYTNLLLELECRSPFVSPALRELFEKAMNEIAYPLTESNTYEAEYASEIGHFTPDGFHVDNLPLLVRVHEENMALYGEKLRKLAADVQSML